MGIEGRVILDATRDDVSVWTNVPPGVPDVTNSTGAFVFANLLPIAEWPR